VTHRLEITRAAVDGGAETIAPRSLGLTRKTTTVQATAQSLPISVLDLVPARVPFAFAAHFAPDALHAAAKV
jgi:hypothetical protein